MSRDATRSWSQWLRRYRDARDLTQEQLGEVLGVDGKTVSAWENGQRPGRRHARTICARLGTTRAELGLVELPDGPSRREFLRLSAGVWTLAVFGPWAGVESIGVPAMGDFETATAALARLWARVGPAAALGPTLGHVESVTRLLQGSLPSATRAPLCGVLAEASVQLAVCKGWIGDHDGADHFAGMALNAARESGDPDLPVYVLISSTSGDRRLHGSPELRLQRYVAGDHGFSVADAGPATRTWAATRAADVLASLGQVEGCLRALDQAGNLLAGAVPNRYPWPDDQWLSGERGTSLARLGRTSDAREALASALAQTGEDRFMDRLWWKLAMARTDAHDGDVEQASRIALDVLHAARRMRHGQLEDEVARFHAPLSTSGAPGVRALGMALSRQPA